VTEDDARPFSRRSALLFATGLVVLTLAAFTLNLTLRTLTFWWYQADLVRTDFVVTDLSDRRRDPLLFGTVTATGEDIHTALLPTELFAYDTPSDATGRLRSDAKIRGLRIPMWYQSGRHSMVGSPSIYWVSEYGTLPSAGLALGTLAVNAAMAGVGVACVRRALRRQ
jgi:hypothetical protein